MTRGAEGWLAAIDCMGIEEEQQEFDVKEKYKMSLASLYDVIPVLKD